MSVTLEVTQHVTFTVGNEVKTFGSLTTPVEISLTTGTVHETRAVVEDDATVETLWTTGDGNFDEFEFLWFLSDADVFLELRTDLGTAEHILVEVKANVPFILNSDNAAGTTATDRLDGSTLVDGTDYAQVDRIRVYNDAAAAAGDATVHLVLGA